MPLVKAKIRPGVEITADSLFLACRQVVPAGMNSAMGRLTPGSIEFDAAFAAKDEYLTVDVFVEVEAFPFEDRENLDERAERIQVALIGIFPGQTFAVWPKLVKAGWASDNTDSEFDGDLSMPAAKVRARRDIGMLQHGASLEFILRG